MASGKSFTGIPDLLLLPWVEAAKAGDLNELKHIEIFLCFIQRFISVRMKYPLIIYDR